MGLGCPRCKVGKLEELELEDVLIDRCNVCAGLWFDQGEIEQMIGEGNDIRRRESEISMEESSMACPRCADVKLREIEFCPSENETSYAYRCASCMGTWIDRGLLRKSEDSQIPVHTRACLKDM